MNKIKQKLFHRLAVFYKASYIKNPFICERVADFIDWPIIRRLYRNIYLPVISKKTSARPTQIAVEVDNVCNLKCVMCPYPEITRPRETMSMSLFKKVVDEACLNGFTTLNLTVYNEPLLDSLLFERIDYANRKNLLVGFTSNATCLTTEKADRLLKSGLEWIVFSVDSGLKECYERIRVGAHFDTVHRQITEFLRRRKERGLVKPMVVIHATISSRENLNAKEELKQLFPDADYVTNALADSRSKTDFLFTGKFFKKTDRRLYPCPILWGAPTVLSSGRVVFCCKDYNGTTQIGDLNSQPLVDILNSEKLKNIKELHLSGRGHEIASCKNCDSLYRAGFSWWSVPDVTVKSSGDR